MTLIYISLTLNGSFFMSVNEALTRDELSKWDVVTIDLEKCPNCAAMEPDVKTKGLNGPIACCECSCIVFRSLDDFDQWLDEMDATQEEMREKSQIFIEYLLSKGSPVSQIPKEYVGRWWKQSGGIGVFDMQESKSYQYSSGSEGSGGVSVETEVGEFHVFQVSEENQIDAFDIPTGTQYIFIFCAKKVVLEKNDDEQITDSTNKTIYFTKPHHDPTIFPFLCDVFGEDFPYSSADWSRSTGPSIIEQKLLEQDQQ